MKLDCKEIGMEMTITKSSEDTNGRSFEMEWVILPASGSPPLHIHPEAIETYEIREGEMEFNIDGKWIPAKKGDSITVEKGQPHTFRNNSGKPVRLYNTHQPAMEYGKFFTGLYTFANSGLVKNGKMSLKGIIGISTLYSNYPDEIISVKPPAFLMKIFALLGRLTGINYK